MVIWWLYRRQSGVISSESVVLRRLSPLFHEGAQNLWATPPDFLLAALERTACAVFCKENRIWSLYISPKVRRPERPSRFRARGDARKAPKSPFRGILPWSFRRHGARENDKMVRDKRGKRDKSSCRSIFSCLGVPSDAPARLRFPGNG
jgi:hypothetical protein